MTKKVSYLLDYLPDIPNQEPSARLYYLLDYAKRLLKSGIKNPTQKHGLFLLNCFNQESRWVRCFITDELSKIETLPLETKTDFQKSFTDYILQIRQWMKDAAQNGKIDRWEFDRLDDIRSGLFQLLITFNQDCQNKLNAEIRRLIEQNKKDVAGHNESIKNAALQVHQWLLDSGTKQRLLAMAKKIGDDVAKLPTLDQVGKIESKSGDDPCHSVNYLTDHKGTRPKTEQQQLEVDYLLLMACYTVQTEKQGQGRINPFMEFWPESLCLMVKQVLKPSYGDRMGQIAAALLNVEKDLSSMGTDNPPKTTGKAYGDITTLSQFIEKHCKLPRGAAIESKIDLLNKAHRNNKIKLPKLAAPWKNGKTKLFYEADLIQHWITYTKEIPSLFPLKTQPTKE